MSFDRLNFLGVLVVVFLGLGGGGSYITFYRACSRSSAVANMLLLGMLSQYLEFPDKLWTTALRGQLPTKILELSLKAFPAGSTMALSAQHARTGAR